MPGIPSMVLSSAVHRPAAQPARNAISIATGTGTPFEMRTTATTPPRPRVPSTVRSAKSSIL